MRAHPFIAINITTVSCGKISVLKESASERKIVKYRYLTTRNFHMEYQPLPVSQFFVKRQHEAAHSVS
jgi:hypothetical protein